MNSNQEENQETKTIELQGETFEVIGGVTCPVDPMERLQCDSCQ